MESWTWGERRSGFGSFDHCHLKPSHLWYSIWSSVTCNCSGGTALESHCHAFSTWCKALDTFVQCSSQLAWLRNKYKNMLTWRKMKGQSKFLWVITQNIFLLMEMIKKIMVHFPENLDKQVHWNYHELTIHKILVSKWTYLALYNCCMWCDTRQFKSWAQGATQKLCVALCSVLDWV